MKSCMLVGFAIIFFSCHDKKAQWLEYYAQSKCAYITEKNKIHYDSLEQIAPLVQQHKQIESKLTEAALPHTSKLSQLNNMLRQASGDYMKAYRKLQDDQNAKHGHISTPDYERKLNALERNRTSGLNAIQRQIALVNEAMQKDTSIIRLSEKLKTQEAIITTTFEAIIAKHKYIIDSLQQNIDVANTNYKYLKRELTTDEQTALEQKRDSIRLNPCK